MARGKQVSKMGKRKRSTKWGTAVTKYQRDSNGRRAVGQITGLGPRDYGFPDRLRTKLRYCDTYTLASTSTQKQQSFKLNSLYDPDETGLGHQPMWFDQLISIYNEYTVRYAKMTVTFSQTDPPALVTDVRTPTLVGIIGSQANTIAASNARTLMELNDGDVKLLTDVSGGNNVKVCTVTYNPKRDTGFDADDANNKCPASSNPITPYYGNMFKFSQGAVASNIVANVVIEYWCEFSDRKEITAS